MKAPLALLTVCLAAGGSNHILCAAENWQDLFDGKTLNGWVQRGGKASYKVEDGSIVGRTVTGTPNSFLCTEKTYGDFILEFEFKVAKAMNSGVQFRSKELPEVAAKLGPLFRVVGKKGAQPVFQTFQRPLALRLKQPPHPQPVTQRDL